MLYEPVIQSLIHNQDHQVDILRLDLMDEEISGNKWFKLKYNIEAAKKAGHHHLITFGGAYSNHIAATAAACKKAKLKCTAIIRGEEQIPLNCTLARAKNNGMQLHFVSREDYDKKTESEFQHYLENLFGSHYLIPEGGNNEKGIMGCREILDPNWSYDYICCACGTGATYAGLVASVNEDQKVIGISVLKGENVLVEDVKANLKNIFPQKSLLLLGNEALQSEAIKDNCITNLYAFKGYAKLDQELIEFKKKFESNYPMQLDYVYTNKLVYAVFDLLTKKKFKSGSSILIIHSGGLQGNEGFEARYHLMPSR